MRRGGIAGLQLVRTLKHTEPAFHTAEHLIRRLANDLYVVRLVHAGSAECGGLSHAQTCQDIAAQPRKLWFRQFKHFHHLKTSMDCAAMRHCGRPQLTNSGRCMKSTSKHSIYPLFSD